LRTLTQQVSVASFRPLFCRNIISLRRSFTLPHHLLDVRFPSRVSANFAFPHLHVFSMLVKALCFHCNSSARSLPDCVNAADGFVHRQIPAPSWLSPKKSVALPWWAHDMHCHFTSAITFPAPSRILTVRPPISHISFGGKREPHMNVARLLPFFLLVFLADSPLQSSLLPFLPFERALLAFFELLFV